MGLAVVSVVEHAVGFSISGIVLGDGDSNGLSGDDGDGLDDSDGSRFGDGLGDGEDDRLVDGLSDGDGDG